MLKFKCFNHVGELKMSSRLSSAQLKSLEVLPHNDIVVVTDGIPCLPVVDIDEQRLIAIPAFTPLLNGSIVPSSTAVNQLTLLDMLHVTALCARYQDHLHQCAEAVTFDQNALCVRIKEVCVTLLFRLISNR
jgi:BLOC-1 related complex subunit 5